MIATSPQVRIALKPLLETAVGLEGEARREWLDALRFECPTVSRALEGLMRERMDAAPDARGTTLYQRA